MLPIVRTILYNQNLDYCLKLLIETVKILMKFENIPLLLFIPLCTRNPELGTLASSEDPDEMPHINNAAYHWGMHCLLKSLSHQAGFSLS